MHAKPNPKKKARPNPKKATQPQDLEAASSSRDSGNQFNADLSKMKLLMKYRASPDYKAAALGLFSFRRIDQQMSHPCRAVAVVFRRLTVSCGCGVQETRHLLGGHGFHVRVLMHCCVGRRGRRSPSPSPTPAEAAASSNPPDAHADRPATSDAGPTPAAEPASEPESEEESEEESEPGPISTQSLERRSNVRTSTTCFSDQRC